MFQSQLSLSLRFSIGAHVLLDFFVNYTVQHKHSQHMYTLECTVANPIPMNLQRTKPTDLEIHKVTASTSLSTETSLTPKKRH